MRKVICLAALFVSCATIDQIRLPWMNEPDAAEQARDEQEEQRRIEQRLKTLERESAPPVPPPPPPEAADPFADEAVLAAERAAVLRPDPPTDDAELTEDVDLTAEPPAAKVKTTKAKAKKTRPTGVATQPEPEPPEPPPPMRVCCKYCDAGKPCGDTCIAANKTCRVGRGCAC